MPSLNLGKFLNHMLRPTGFSLVRNQGQKSWDHFGTEELGIHVRRSDQSFSQRMEGPQASELTLPSEDLPKLLDCLKLKGKRVLEIGPKDGLHSRWIVKNLEPSTFHMIELPMRKGEFDPLAGLTASNAQIWYCDIFHANDLSKLPPFDLIFCIGVLYHTVEQLKLLSYLNRLLAADGTMLFQTTALKVPGSFVDLRWQPGRPGNFMIPTVEAVFRMMAMTGWDDIVWFTQYRPRVAALLLECKKSGRPVFSYTGSPFGGSTI